MAGYVVYFIHIGEHPQTCNVWGFLVFVFPYRYWVQHHLLNYLDSVYQKLIDHACVILFTSFLKSLPQPPWTPVSVSSPQQDSSALLGVPLPAPRSKIFLKAESQARLPCFPSLQGPVLCCLLSMSESSCFIYFVLFSSFSQWKGRFHAPPKLEAKICSFSFFFLYFSLDSFYCFVFKFSEIFLYSV